MIDVVYSANGLVFAPTEIEHGMPIYNYSEVVGLLCMNEVGVFSVRKIKPTDWAWEIEDIPDAARETSSVGAA